MIRPCLCAWVEEQYHLIADRIDGREIWPFMMVAVRTGQCQIAGLIISTMLTGTDMLNVKTIDRGKLLRQQAVFATMIRPLPNQLARGFIYDY